MSATNLFEDDLLDLLFTNVAAPNVGDAAGLPPSVGAGTWTIALHTGNTIDDTSTVQSQAVAAYTGYSNQTVVRSVAGWTVATGTATNDAVISFGIATGGTPETETDVSLGSFGSVMQIFSTLDADLIVNIGVKPEFAISALAISLD